jgi:hypothetical protein
MKMHYFVKYSDGKFENLGDFDRPSEAIEEARKGDREVFKIYNEDNFVVYEKEEKLKL